MNPPTTIALIALTLIAAAASVVAVMRLRRKERSATLDKWQQRLVWVNGLGCVALFVIHWLALNRSWAPLASHLDGLLLLTALFGVQVMYLTHGARMPGLAAFAMPLQTLVLTWAFCASWFTFRPFGIDNVWKNVHLASVYVGAIFFGVASIAGGMYLYVQRQLKSKGAGGAGGPVRRPGKLGGLVSLEALETLIVRGATIGFGLITLGLVTGLVIVTDGPSKLGEQWWLSPKVILATSVWAVYALVMNVKHTTTFRGARAAWLAIGGLVLMLATFAAVNALPSATPSNAQPNTQPGAQVTPRANDANVNRATDPRRQSDPSASDNTAKPSPAKGGQP